MWLGFSIMMASHIPSSFTRLPLAPKLHGGKRGATGPLINISSSDEDETESSPSPSPRLPLGSNLQPQVRSKSPSIQQACEAYEHDHDYENVASPVSSTSSGPIYVRPPGFRYHGHEILAKREKIKKKKTTPLLDFPVRLRRRAPTPPKIKPRKGEFIIHLDYKMIRCSTRRRLHIHVSYTVLF